MTDRYKESIQGARDCVERNKDGGVYLPDLVVVIDSQQAEIERLNVELVGMRGACNSYKMHYDNAKAEIERLNNEMDCRDFKNEADVVEVKHGRWETRSFIIFDSEKVGYRCSECKTTWDTETNYCPNCGSDMRKEGEGK